MPLRRRSAAASREVGAQVRRRSRGAAGTWPVHGPRVPRLFQPSPPRPLLSQHPQHSRLHLRHRRRLRSLHRRRRRRRGPQPPHPPAGVVRGRASARPLHPHYACVGFVSLPEAIFHAHHTVIYPAPTSSRWPIWPAIDHARLCKCHGIITHVTAAAVADSMDARH